MASGIKSFYTPSTPSQMSSRASPTVDEFLSKYSSAMTGSSVVSNTVDSSSCKKRRSPLQRLMDHIHLEYYRYEVTYGVYTMTPGEKLVANMFVMVVLTLLLWTFVFYFPPLLYHKLSRLVWLLTGHPGEGMGAVWNVIDTNASSVMPSPLAPGRALDF